MCLSCGCGDPHGGHGDEGHVTAETIAAAAKASDIPFDKAVENIVKGVEHMSPEDKQKAMEMAGDEKEQPGSTSGS